MSNRKRWGCSDSSVTLWDGLLLGLLFAALLLAPGCAPLTSVVGAPPLSPAELLAVAVALVQLVLPRPRGHLWDAARSLAAAFGLLHTDTARRPRAPRPPAGG